MDRKTLGNILLLMGVLAWVAYFSLKALTDWDLQVGYFLTWHLLGVIPGMLLRGSKLLARLKGNKEQSENQAA